MQKIGIESHELDLLPDETWKPVWSGEFGGTDPDCFIVDYVRMFDRTER